MNNQPKSYSFAFERMIAWKETSNFPKTEIYCLTSQMRRASIGISSNLSEGSGRTSPKDQAHFYQMAYSSLMELLNQLYTSVDLDYISEAQFSEIRDHICSISFLINSLRKSCLNKLS
jgi:four helix bundle protein